MDVIELCLSAIYSIYLWIKYRKQIKKENEEYFQEKRRVI
jgi:hypothetical protein